MASSLVPANDGDSVIKIYFKHAWLYMFLFFIFIINLTAVSVSMQCNKHRGLIFKIASAIFAFMFGFIYIMINYFAYRVTLKKEYCDFSKVNIFPIY